MSVKFTFHDLLAQKSPVDTEKLQAEVAKAESEKAKVQEKLTGIDQRLKELRGELNTPVRDAVKAANLLGIAVPEEYQKIACSTGNGHGNGGRGKFNWEAKGHVPFKANVSNAMYRLSHGSGTGGKNGENVFTSAEFWNHVKQSIGVAEDALEQGKQYTVKFPNGKEVAFTKLAD